MPYLFSYGTLQQKEVQLSTFGRELDGRADSLTGFILAEVRIEDQDVIAKSGKGFHPIAKATGLPGNRVAGIVFEISEEELLHSDRYEVDAYTQVETTLESGRAAWVYVEA